MLKSMVQDLRYGLRSLRRQPLFTVSATLALALGIGAATTIFSVIQNVLLNPATYSEVDKIFIVQIRDPKSDRQGRSWFQVPEFLAYQTQSSVFSEIMADTENDILYSTKDGAQHISGALVSGNAFAFLGVNAVIGRTLTLDDVKAGAPAVFVMSYKMWVRDFGLDTAVVGKTFVLNGKPTTLVGIMPRRFTKLSADIWQPAALDLSDPDGRTRFFRLSARLKPGVTQQQAAAQMRSIATRVANVYPEMYPKVFVVDVVTWIDSLVGGFRQRLYTLAIAVSLLLLIACGNVANMLLTKAQIRAKEMAIRASLGASPTRLVCQMLTESLLLAMLGSTLGFGLAYLGLHLFVKYIPTGLIPEEALVQLNGPALLFCLLMAALTALIFGILPAFQTSTRNLSHSLRDSGKGVNIGSHQGWLSEALVTFQVALSIVLLVNAGLLIRTFVNVESVKLGFNPDQLLVSRLSLPDRKYQTVAEERQLFTQLLSQIRTLPGVIEAAVASSQPPFGGIRSDVSIPGMTFEPSLTLVQLCNDGYFRALESHLRKGRLLTVDDVQQGRRVVVINETLAKRYFNNANAIGRLLILSALRSRSDTSSANLPFEVVGVISDTKNRGVRDPTLPESFIPFTVTTSFDRSILVKTSIAPTLLLGSVRRTIWSVDKNIAVAKMGNLKDFLDDDFYSEPRFGMLVLSVFSGTGLVLVIIGVYGVVAFTVSRKAHDIGIRMALGAAANDVRKMVLKLAFRPVGLGILVGVMLTLAAGRVLQSQLWGVKPLDILTLGAVVIVILAAAAFASYLPVRRATQVNPAAAMRSD